jgi:hypothetical protein
MQDSNHDRRLIKREGSQDMEELTKQVKNEMLRTAIWLAASMAMAIAIHYVIWR